MSYFRPIRIPTTGLPLVQKLRQIINERRYSVDGLARKAGVHRDTIHGWRRCKFSPSVANFEAVLNVLGYQLAIVPLPDKPAQPTLHRSEGVPFQ